SVVVVSSKSGGTVETDSQRRAYEQALRDAGRDPAEHLVIVTDPGSQLEQVARESGYRVFTADPGVGGRYSALTAFGLVPSGLAGADTGRLLDEAAGIADAVRADSVDNPALRLGALLGVANTRGVDKVVLAGVGSTLPGLGDWIEQLVAESTGKQGRGILPVVVADPSAPNFTPSTPDEVLVSLGGGLPSGSERPRSGFGASVDAPLGAQMLLWECAVAVAGRVIGINPFDQPDVESAKQAARELLATTNEPHPPLFQDRGVSVHATGGWLPDGTSTVADAVTVLLTHVDPGVGYLAVMAYLDRAADSGFSAVRDALATRTGRPTTFGWGPRFLHSTGQYHKGGPPNGVFLQVTAEPEADMDVPGRDFTFGEFIAAQASGDAAVLADHGRPVLRLHLDGSQEAVEAVRAALR
ncbi:MAG: glucose-6-phosphate isomerase, partial [Nocardioidaceae bacterium]